jgi:hypothetical protein
MFRAFSRSKIQLVNQKQQNSKTAKTINSRYSLVVTQPTTDWPAHGLSMAEQTGSPDFHVLWSIAKTGVFGLIINHST